MGQKEHQARGWTRIPSATPMTVVITHIFQNTRPQWRQLPGSWETMKAVGASIADIVRYGLPDNYYQTYAEKIRQLKTPQLSAAAQKVLQPEKLVWVIVGDRSKIEAGIRELDLGEIHLIDSDGNPVL